MNVIKTRNGLRVAQHGAVISELRLTPGPTHSVFDLLAAAIVVTRLNGLKSGPIGVLGFAAGGMIAPLHALGVLSPIDTCDLDRKSFALFRKHAHFWVHRVRWSHVEAIQWLEHKKNRHFAVLMDDLSIAQNGDITKPDITWRILPALMRKKLKPGGAAIFNLLRPIGSSWTSQIRRIAAQFPTAQLIELEEFENRILIAARKLPPARQMGHQLRAALRQLGSRQANRLRIRTLKTRLLHEPPLALRTHIDFLRVRPRLSHRRKR
jgi:hypothetical protein